MFLSVLLIVSDVRLVADTVIPRCLDVGLTAAKPEVKGVRDEGACPCFPKPRHCEKLVNAGTTVTSPLWDERQDDACLRW
jgi:hypothetical protein